MKLRANVNPTVLRWARERARYEVETLAHRLAVAPAIYRGWESGEAKPTLRQFYTLVQILNRPLQEFFLSAPPEVPEALAEMRRLPGGGELPESPELAEQVDLAVQRREVALRIFADLREVPPLLNLRLTTASEHEHAGKIIRDYLKVAISEQKAWSSPHEAIRGWRSALEAAGVLVFQVPGVPLAEMRGFSLALTPLPIIGVNSRDWPRARIFTLLHEFVHIALGDTMLEAPAGSWFRLSRNLTVEHFCNAVAGAVLLPVDEIRRFVSSFRSPEMGDWDDMGASRIASRYKVSRAVVIRRLQAAGLISPDSYEALRAQYDRFSPPAREIGGGDFYATKIAQLGSLFPELAFRAHYNDRLTLSDLSLLLGLKAPKLGELEERILGYRYAFAGA